MGKSREFYIQDNARWGKFLWYDRAINKALKRMTKSFHAYADDPSTGSKLIGDTNELLSQINKIVRGGKYSQTVRHNGSLAQSGCWHTSVANMLTLFDVKLKDKISTPPVLLKALQEHLLGTLTGYVDTPFVDPLSIITGGDVQLSRYHDFCKDGVDRNDPLLNDLLSSVNGVTTCAIVNVCAHEIFGNDSHYVLVKGTIDNDYIIQDPGWPDTTRLFRDYSKTGFYQVSVYRKYYR